MTQEINFKTHTSDTNEISLNYDNYLFSKTNSNSKNSNKNSNENNRISNQKFI
jgi:hypothetical protein